MISLDDRLQAIWQLLSTATTSRSAFTLMQLATVSVDGQPSLRTVVIRQFLPTLPALRFTADRRSAKMQDIAAQPQVALLAYDAASRVQLRLAGTAQRVDDAQQRAAAWHALSPHSHALFQSPVRPGSVITHPDAALPASAPDVDAGPDEHFALVQITLHSVEWLDVSREPHQRARFEATADGWQGSWRVP
ncbi:pyridoxamine 5'-phosphate oxidase family protein [Pantoea sp. R102]|uniref:pyridoxamine 5'-phosphate oxidase family protein n=1 Tax=Pantoea sp. R102 TaxID=2507583 RepID=UPI0010A87F05|nr:pyridoxamine 5'-phosphate oxidase family protein [Pantoea sp. R102]THD40153.1 pyridoxamine 5'-phosphate oxidase [Pantoea sp. R102]